MHTLSYDVLGRMSSDAVTTLGAGVDGSVRRIEIAYDTQDNPYLFTSYDAASAGNIVNQVQRGFNGLAQLTTEYQSHSGAVNTGTSPKVQYGYTELSGGNNSRLTSMTYPNGKVLNYNYATGLDSTISRLTSLSDNSGTLESYSYLGLDTVVQRARSEISTNLTYIKQTGDSNGDAGDQYIGLDRFGRVVDQRWLNTGTLAATDRFLYGYDRDSNALYRNNLVNTAFGELYHASGAGNGYDNLNQLSGFLRGVLSASGGSGTPLDTISSPSTTESWSPDALGNFSSITTNTTTQTRTHNQQNEITSITGATTPTYDGNGNLTTDEQGQTYKYDAWNRLVQVKNSGGTVIASYSYDGLGRRIQETHSGTVNDLYYSATWQVLEERTGGVGTATVQYVWSPVYVDALVLRDRSTQNNGTLDERLWVQQDPNWNVTALVNSSGQVVERYIYDPYGQVTYLNGTFGTISGSAYAWVYGFQGLRLDTVTGNNDERERQYRASLGRFVQIDPIGIDGGDTNFYRAEGNSPVNATDPSGLFDDEEIKLLRKLFGIREPPLKNNLKMGPELKAMIAYSQGYNAGSAQAGEMTAGIGDPRIYPQEDCLRKLNGGRLSEHTIPKGFQEVYVPEDPMKPLPFGSTEFVNGRYYLMKDPDIAYREGFMDGWKDLPSRELEYSPKMIEESKTQLAADPVFVLPFKGAGAAPVHSVYADGLRVYEGQQPPRLPAYNKCFDPAANGAPHSVLRWDFTNTRLYQAREYGAGHIVIRDIAFTNPTYPNGVVRPGHPGPPHQHPWFPVDPNNPNAGFFRDPIARPFP